MMRRVLPSSFSALPTTKRKQQSNPSKLTTHSTQSHLSTQTEKQEMKLTRRDRKLLFACFMTVLVTWMSFTSDVRGLRRDVFSMLETHIVMNSLSFRLALTLVLHLTHLLVLCHISLMDLTIAHMILVHVRTALCREALDMAHVLIVVIVPRVGLVFLLDGLKPILS
jgi:hypothetical protein